MFEYKFNVYTICRVWALSACSIMIIKLAIGTDMVVPNDSAHLRYQIFYGVCHIYGCDTDD